MKIVATDLDGTLLPAGGRVSGTDVSTLRMLGNRKVTRVIATGRSFYAMLRNIPRTFPIDYLIFSTGVGIMDWRTGKTVSSASMQPEKVQALVDHFKRFDVDFMLHQPAPDTHKFLYQPSSSPSSDFIERQRHYPDHCFPMQEAPCGESSQLLAIIPNDMELFRRITADLTDYKVVRTTSPISSSSIWIEVFEKDVSKGHALEYLARMLNVSPQEVMAIGNDYNDVDMLNFTPNSFVVSNAPDDLKARYRVVRSADKSAFSEAVGIALSAASKR